MSKRTSLTRFTPRGGDGFISLIEKLEGTADPLSAASRKVAARTKAVPVAEGSQRTADVETISHGIAGEGETFEALVEGLRGDLGLRRPASVTQALRNAELRTAYLAEVGAFTAAEVARLAGSRAKNSSSLAGRWRSESRVFSVSWGGEALYPSFQFVDGEPHPAIAQVIEATLPEVTGWQLAIWFATPSAYLPGNALPMDRLHDAASLTGALLSELQSPDF